MKSKKRIKKLETQFSELKKQIQKSSVTITDECDPNLKAVISFENGEFTIRKISTSTAETPELIFKDNK